MPLSKQSMPAQALFPTIQPLTRKKRPAGFLVKTDRLAQTCGTVCTPEYEFSFGGKIRI